MIHTQGHILLVQYFFNGLCVNINTLLELYFKKVADFNNLMCIHCCKNVGLAFINEFSTFTLYQTQTVWMALQQVGFSY